MELRLTQESRRGEGDRNARSARIREEITHLQREQEEHEEELRLQRVKAEMDHKRKLAQLEHDIEIECLQILARAKECSLQDDLECETGFAHGEGAQAPTAQNLREFVDMGAVGAPVE